MEREREYEDYKSRVTGGGVAMKRPNDEDRLDHTPERLNEFEKRAQRILDRLDEADRIFDNMQTEKKRPDTLIDKLDEVFESIERGLKKLFSNSFSQIMKPTDMQEQPEPLVPKSLARYLQSCSDEQLAAISSEIDRILTERSSR
jgi:hypothetical protein